MAVLGVDTAGRVGGVAIVQGGRLLGQQVLGVEERHSANLLPSLSSLMKAVGLGAEDVTGLAVSIGPGSFTGLRIGLAAVKGLAYSWRVPVHGVSTLFATAWSLRGVDAVVCASLDARRQSVFCAFYDGGRMSTESVPGAALLHAEARLDVGEALQRARAFTDGGRNVIWVGDGARVVTPAVAAGTSDLPSQQGKWVRLPMDGEAARPANVAHVGEIQLGLGRRDDPFALVPNYLRRSEAERRWQQKQS